MKKIIACLCAMAVAAALTPTNIFAVSGGPETDLGLIALSQSTAVSITSPREGAVVMEGSNVTITADVSVSDAGGRIALVEFYDGGVKIASVDAVPYTCVIQEISRGFHTVTAVAADSFGDFSRSAPVKVTAARFIKDEKFVDEDFDSYEETVIPSFWTGNANGGGITFPVSPPDNDLSGRDGRSLLLSAPGAGNEPFMSRSFPRSFSGRMSIEMNFYTSSRATTKFIVFFKNTNGGDHYPVRFMNNGNISYGQGGSGSVLGTARYEADRWYYIRFVVDVSNRYYDLYIHDGNSVVIDKKNLAFAPASAYPLASFRVAHTGAGTSEARAYYDDLKIYTLKEAPDLMAAEFVDESGKVEKNLSDIPIASKEIALYFNKDMDTAALTDENITIRKISDGSPVSCRFNYISGEKKAALSLDEPFDRLSGYSLSLKDTVKDAGGVFAEPADIEFHTCNTPVDLDDVVFKNANGANVSSLSEVVAAGNKIYCVAALRNESGASKDVTVMMAIYKKVQLANSPRIILTMTDITFKTAVVPDGVLRQELELELPLSAAVSDGYTVKVFAVDGVAGARPISNGIALSQSEIH